MNKWRKPGRPKKKPKFPQAKLLRCLQMINLLEQRRVSMQEMGERFGLTSRSVYRYIALFEEIGYSVDRDFNGRFFIFGKPVCL